MALDAPTTGKLAALRRVFGRLASGVKWIYRQGGGSAGTKINYGT